MNNHLVRTSIIALAGALGLSLIGTAPVLAQTEPVAQRAIEGAKAYVKANGLENPKLDMLLNSLFRNVMPEFTAEWKELTGVEIVLEPLGYTDIPAKIMGEAVAKTGAFDLFNDMPQTQPDAGGSGVLKPLDEYAAKYKPDFSGIPSAFTGQQKYNGKLYSMVLDGDLDSGIEGVLPNVFANLNRAFDMLLDTSETLTVLHATEVTTSHG